MKLPWGSKKKKKEPNKNAPDWERMSEVVDKIWEATLPEREKMKRFRDLYHGKIWDEARLKSWDSHAVVNYFFSTIQQIAPMLTDNRPVWSVVAKEPFLQNVAAAYSKALKYAWQSREMNTKLHKAVLDALITKVGILKVVFDPTLGIGGDIDVAVVDPLTFFLAPGYDDIWEAPWCGVRVRKPLSWIKRRFPEISEISPDPDGMEESQSSAVKFGEVLDFELDNMFATVTELWIKDDPAEVEMLEEGEVTKKPKFPNGKFVYFTSTQFLGEEPCDYDHGLPPYVAIYDYTPVHNFLGIGEIDNIEGLVLEANSIFQKMFNHSRKYSNPNVVVDTATGIDPETVKATYHEGGQIFVADSNAAPNAKQPITVVNEPMLNPINSDLLRYMPQLIEEITGVTEIAKGVLTTKQERSASEVSVLIESSYTRIRQRVRNLEMSIQRLCYLWIRMMQQYYVEPRSTYEQKDGEIIYDVVSNSRSMAEELVRDPLVQTKLEQGKRLSPEQEQMQSDYKALIATFDDPSDPVFFDFDIVIETNSTLPMDKQSLANLMTRLFERKAIDAQALLETLGIPRYEEILGRMEQQKPQAPQGGQPKPQGAPQIGGPQ